MASNKLDEIRAQLRVCDQDLAKLEALAGIAALAESLRSEPAHYEHIYDAAERYSDRQRELERHEELIHQERTTSHLRKLYFSVPDRELRIALIRKDREAGDLVLHYWRQELADAASRSKAAQSAHHAWWVWASVWGAVFIGLGYFYFGPIGGMAGLLIGYFWGRQIEHRTRVEREKAIAEAERELREAEQNWNEVRNEPQTFTQREAKTGDPEISWPSSV